MAEEAKLWSSHLARLKDHHAPLHLLLRKLSQRRFVDFTGRTDIHLAEVKVEDDFIYGAHVSIIQLAARDLRLTFKAHFNLSEVETLTLRKNAGTRTNKELRRSTYDLFREYTNLVAGAMAKQFQGDGVLAGISLPLATSGFNEVIASDELLPHRLVDYWTIRGSDFEFICSIHLDILRPDVLEQLAHDEVSAEGEGDIELL